MTYLVVQQNILKEQILDKEIKKKRVNDSLFVLIPV